MHLNSKILFPTFVLRSSLRTKTGSIDNARSPNVQSKLGFPCELPEDLVTDLDIQAKFEIDDKKVILLLVAK